MMQQMTADSTGRRYDRIGVGYAVHRRPDPRWAATIPVALGDAATVLNVGAGTGSERAHGLHRGGARAVADHDRPNAPRARRRRCTAAQRRSRFLTVPSTSRWPSSPCITGPTRRVESPSSDRVASRQVVVTWDPVVFAKQMWLVADYLPEVYEWEATLATEHTCSHTSMSERSHHSWCRSTAPTGCSVRTGDGRKRSSIRRPGCANSCMALLDPPAGPPLRRPARRGSPLGCLAPQAP